MTGSPGRWRGRGKCDAVHNTVLVETLRARLDAFGDVNAAAAVLFVHPNTFRYRLRRLAEAVAWTSATRRPGSPLCGSSAFVTPPRPTIG